MSDILWAIFAATLLSLMIEAPTLGLEKILMGGKKHDKEEKGKLEGKKEEKSENVQLLSGEENARRGSIITSVSVADSGELP
jgi:hypothetical protein